MILLLHELRKGRLTLLLWSMGISFMLGICILIYPEMAGQMSELSTMFSDMGNFSAAFGMDQLNFGEFKGYFGIECGNTLGIGGAIFASFLGISALGKEEERHTAEFLLTHPVSRETVYGQKLLAVYLQILMLNLIVGFVTAGTTILIGESLPLKESAILLFAHFLLQIEIASITFGVSSCLRSKGIGIGIGLTLILYCINLISNLVQSGEILKYITPFSYADSASIMGDGNLKLGNVLCGYSIAVISLLTGLYHYRKKDIQ